IAGPLIATAWLAWRPEDYRGLFAATLIPGLIVIALAWTTREPVEPTEPVEPVEPIQPVEPTHRWSSLPAPTRRAILVFLLFSLGNSTDAFLLLMLQSAGMPIAWLPAAWAGLHVVKSASSLAGGALSDRVGYRAPIVAGWIYYAAIYAGF